MKTRKPGAVLALFLCCAWSSMLAAEASEKATPKSASASASTKTEKKALDHSGKTRHGKASYYSRKFAGKKMADGTPMTPEKNIAASRTLPLGTKAKVTNLETGKSTQVEIRDRGPYVDGRIIDLSPKAAREIDIQKQGVAPVAVTPIEVPGPGSRDRSEGADGGGNSASGR